MDKKKTQFINEVQHINGDCTDNSLDNLAIIRTAPIRAVSMNNKSYYECFLDEVMRRRDAGKISAETARRWTDLIKTLQQLALPQEH